MTQLALMIVLTAFALGYASVLLYIRLGSSGVSMRRIRRVLLELWGTFALIVTAMAMGSSFIGPVAQSGIARETVSQWALYRALPSGQQALIAVTLGLTVLLFVHLVWSLRTAQSQVRYAGPVDGEEA